MEGLLKAIESWGYELSRTLQTQLQARSAAAIFVVFAAGVLTSFTPCVYPMIPVTITFIGGAAGGNRRRAVGMSAVYVLGLVLVYDSLGIAAALAGRMFGQFTRSPWVFGAVGILILVFGVAMLDWIHIPAFLAGVQSQGARTGGFGGALLMGMAAGFVAAPCTAPVLGLLLTYVATTRDVVWGGALLLVFALGLSLLLMLFGIFSGFLASLPRAGSWMDVVKKVFGVLMLIIGGYFLWQAATMLLVHGARG